MSLFVNNKQIINLDLNTNKKNYCYLNDKLIYSNIKPFTTPILKSNGTIGVSDFAVSAKTAGSGWEAYRAFDTTSVGGWAGEQAINDYLFYSKKPLRLTSIQFERQLNANNFIMKFNLLGSLDNSTWITLLSDADTMMYQYWTPPAITISTDKYLNYFKIQTLTYYTRSAFKRLFLTGYTIG